MICAGVRALFNEFIQVNACTVSRLSLTSSIVHQLIFESAVVKVQEGKANQWTREEEESVLILKFESAVIEANNTAANLTIAERRLKRCWIDIDDNTKHFDAQFLLPTSDVCESLIYMKRYALDRFFWRSEEEKWKERGLLC